jgi:hypothetical protein
LHNCARLLGIRRFLKSAKIDFDKKRIIYQAFLRSKLEYGLLAAWTDSSISKEEIEDLAETWDNYWGRFARAWMLGLTEKTNKRIVEFEADMVPFSKRINDLYVSYLIGVEVKASVHQHKQQELTDLLLAGTPEEELARARLLKNQYENYLSTRVAGGGPRTSRVRVKVTFTNYRSQVHRRNARVSRWNRINQGTGETDRFYIRWCVPSASAARATRLIHRNSQEITRARAGFSIKDATRNNIKKWETRYVSDVHPAIAREASERVKKVSTSSHVALLIAEEDLGEDRDATEYNYYWGKDMAELRNGVKFGMEMSIREHQLEDFTAMDVLVCSPRFERHIQRILNQSIVKDLRVLHHGLAERILYPFNEVLHKGRILATDHMVLAPTLRRIQGRTDEQNNGNAT